MITNYYASRKTRKPFCGLECCGNAFGIHQRHPSHHTTNPIRKMRRYARRAERNLIKREIEAQLQDELEYMLAELREFERQCEEDSAYEDYLWEIEFANSEKELDEFHRECELDYSDNIDYPFDYTA